MATNLEFITSVELNGANSYNITDIFSDKYDIYQIVTQGIDHNNTSREVYNFRLINSSGVSTSASYDYAKLLLRTDTTYTQVQGTNDTRWNQFVADGYGKGSGSVTTIYNPYSSSTYTYMLSAGVGWYDIVSGNVSGSKYCGVYKVAEQITGLNIYDNGNFILYNGKVSVFGVR